MAVIKEKMTMIWAYIGATIGAGFASGQEIMQFFVRYGEAGFMGCLTSGFLFALCGAVLLFYIHKHQTDDYRSMLRVLLGEKLGRLMDGLVSVFLFLGISTMLSAAGAIFFEHLYWPKSWGIMLAYGSILLLLIRGKQGLVRSFNLLVPLKITLLLIVGLAALSTTSRPAAMEVELAFLHQENAAWILPSFLYVAYNFVLAMVILIEYKPLAGRTNGVIGAWLGGLILGVILLLNYLALSRFLPAVLHYEVPMLYVSGQVSLLLKKVFIGVLLMGILTTALANTHGLSSRAATASGLAYPICLGLVLTAALPLALINFSTLVNVVYPLLGMLGLVILAALIGKGICEMM